MCNVTQRPNELSTEKHPLDLQQGHRATLLRADLVEERGWKLEWKGWNSKWEPVNWRTQS